ncbi:MAG: hypothetical protein ACLP1D_15770, partial [Xanthobacteraceae bacterium]
MGQACGNVGKRDRASRAFHLDLASDRPTAHGEGQLGILSAFRFDQQFGVGMHAEPQHGLDADQILKGELL